VTALWAVVFVFLPCNTESRFFAFVARLILFSVSVEQKYVSRKFFLLSASVLSFGVTRGFH
jgi:general stress protein CsbA